MLTETYGGICPNCGYDRMMMRYGSWGNLQLDACPKCGFAYANNGYDPELKGEQVWRAIWEAEKNIDYEKTLYGTYKWLQSMPEPHEMMMSTFDWTDRDKKFLESFTWDDGSLINIEEKVLLT